MEPKEEKLEFLKREEVRTMAKDLARLREQEAKKERERIAKLKTEKEARLERERLEKLRKEAEERERLERERLARKIMPEPTPPAREHILDRIKSKIKHKPVQGPPEIEIRPAVKPTPPTPTAPTAPPVPPPITPAPAPAPSQPPPLARPALSKLDKILIRILIILNIFFISTFLYWYFSVRKAEPKVPEEITPPPEEERVITPEEILANLSLKEKVGQLFIVGIDGKSITPEINELFQDIPPGGIILFSKNIESENQTKNLINELQNLSQESVGLPLFIATDQEGGLVSRISFLKEQTAQSEIEDESQAFQVGLERGKELKALGFNLNLAPVLDQLKPGDFLYQRSFQKDAQTSGKLGRAIVEGQKRAGILSAIKHFPGYAGINFNPEEQLSRLQKVPEISQFQEAVKANPEFVMVGNSIIAELDALKRFLFSENGINFLKENLPGDYLIITDDLSQNVFLQKFAIKDIVTAPINAGVDVLLFTDFREDPRKALIAFLEAVDEGIISQQKIDQLVLKVIKLKVEKLGKTP